ncbi:MAG: hypothetical protein AABO57_01465 [Acidobacteriota bacterium]
MRRYFCSITLCALIALGAVPARSQAAREATIEPETKAKIVLQTRLSSKLSEPGDPVRAVIDEPLYVNDQLVLPRGTEFIGRVTQVTPARRPQKQGSIAIAFERIVLSWGEEPVSVVVTSLDDWDKNEKLNADSEGKVKGGHKGENTARNVERGGVIGGAGAGVVILSGGGLGAGAASLGGGLLGGLLLTKGGEVFVAPGAIFRVKFVKPITLPVVQAGSPPRSIQQDDAKPAQPSDRKPPGQ